MLIAIKSTDFYQQHRAPKQGPYDSWVTKRAFTDTQSSNIEEWNSDRIDNEKGPYIRVEATMQTFKIHTELVSMLQLGPLKKLDASGFDDHIVRGVIELAYNINRPFPLIHDLLISASVPPFPSEKLDDKLSLIELAVRWRLEPVVDLLSLGMGVEQVVNVFQHAYINYEAQQNGWIELLSVCRENEKNQMYSRAVKTIVKEIADGTEDERDRAFVLGMIAHLNID
ncbi:hypothetical protein AAF712_012693 [Marasmius tenuissimus]|uniref:Uncharacterized protein n=1 Tax=Marasmius tenuissimus TaxID=585030 RepID=A0ABR2ZGN2_9AGAR